MHADAEVQVPRCQSTGNSDVRNGEPTALLEKQQKKRK